MSWMKGVGPVKDIDELGRSKGLDKHWYSNKKQKWVKRRKEIKKGNFWDIIDNPLFQVAGEAQGFDWDDWVKDAKGKVGTGPNDGLHRVKAIVKPAQPGRTRGISGGPNAGIQYVTTQGEPAEYEYMTREEAEDRGLDYEEAKTTRWRNKETGEIHESAYPPSQDPNRKQLFDLPSGRGPYGAADIIRRRMDEDWEDNWEELRDWGSHDEDVNKDLDEMSKWLHDIIQVNDHLPKIIREGPKGEHYGIEGDIWEHYGLDQELEPPKEMEWDSYDKKMQLATAVTSTEGYSTPEGIPVVDLHGD